MKKLYLVFLTLILSMMISGCMEKKVNPIILKSTDEKALYDLMEARCRALNAKDINLFRQIYIKDSPDLRWIKDAGISMWVMDDVTYHISSLKKIGIIGNDAAARFVVVGSDQYGSFLRKTVEVLYVKKGTQWKIESTGERLR